MPKAAQRQFLVSVEGVTGFFATKTGGVTSADTTDVFDGGSTRPEKLAAPATTDNIVTGRPYDTERDQPVVNRLRPQVGRWRTTVAVQPTDADLVPVGPPEVYANALLVRVQAPEVDAASGDAAMLELEFAVEAVATA